MISNDSSEVPLNLGIFNDSFPPILDGVTLTVQNYAHWLSRMGHKPVVVTPWNPVHVEVPYPVIKYFSLPIANRAPYRYGYPKLDPFVWRRVSKRGFSLLHSHCPFSSGRLALYVKKKQNIPLIATFHSKYKSDLEHSFKHAPWIVNMVMKKILHFFEACDEVWIPQAEVEPTVREYGYKGRLTVVENGIDFAGLPEQEVERYRQKARQSLDLKPETLSLLFVGQHILEKGIGVIVDALALLPSGFDFRMDFIGSGYAAQEIKRKVETLGLSGEVHFHGIIPEREKLRLYYSASDLFLFPSFYDNAPLVVREAAALGTPAILPAGSTAAEVIRDGENGFLTGRSPREYADMIMRLAEERDRIREAGLNARHSIVRSWEDVVGEVSDRYRVILKNFR